MSTHSSSRTPIPLRRKAGLSIVANKEQRKTQKAAPKSNKQKKEAAKEKKAAKAGFGPGLKKD